MECIGKMAQRAAIFQEELCVAILRGIRAQLLNDKRMRPGEVGMVEEAGVMMDGHDEVIMSVRDASLADTCKHHGAGDGGHGTCPVADGSPRLKPCTFRASSSCAVGAKVAENLVQARLVARHQCEYGQNRDIVASVSNRRDFIDDLTGLPLPPDLCRAARQKEIAYFRAKGVWELRPVAEAKARMGRRPISVRWVETNKGDDDNPNIRSRLVAREIRAPGEDAIFAPTPPLESLRMIISMAATTMQAQGWMPDWNPDSESRTQILMIDISRAYFNAKTSDD